MIRDECEQQGQSLFRINPQEPETPSGSVLYAVRPDRGYFDVSPPGRVIVEADGFTKFEPLADGRHRYLKLSDLQRARVLEALVQLSSQPPK